MTSESRDRAVVLGAGMAGLLAARVLADHYGEVLVIDRDRLDDDTPRRGTPQARHLHALLPRGQQAIEGLFPGLTADLVAGGAPKGDMLADTRLCFGGHRFAPGESGLTMLSVDRLVLEQAIRHRVGDRGDVELLGGRDVVGLLAAPADRRVIGVRVISREDGSAEEALACDLVIDATGRGSRMPAWLETLGHARPPVERMHVGVGYASRRYRLSEAGRGRELGLLSAPAPDRPRGGALSRLGPDHCLVTLIGMLGDHPPTDPDAFERFAADLALPEVHKVMLDAEPLDDPVRHHHPTSVRHRYDRLTTMPDGVVVVGDAVCSLNPIYGQGMTVAALEAVSLGRHLAKGRLRAHRVQQDIGKVSGVAWSLSTGADLSFPGVEGNRTPMTGLLGRYVARIQAGAAADPALGRAFLRVTSMVDPPQALLRPATFLRTASGRRVGRRRGGRAY